MNNNIDEVYEKMLSAAEITESEKLKLTDEQVDEILSAIDGCTDDDLMVNAKKAAESSDLKDEAVVASINIDTVTGKPVSVDEVDLDDENIKSFEEYLDTEGINIPDVDIDKMVAKFAIAQFFAIDNTEEALENNGVTDEAIDKVYEIIEKYKIYQKTGKKFSYYNAMPDSIKSLIERFQGANALKMVGNMNREARNYIAACMMNAIIDCNVADVLTDDLNRSIAKMNKELQEDEAWGETRRYFSEDLPNLISGLEQDGEQEKADKGRLVIASFNEACNHELLCEAIPSLKIRHIDMEDFEKYCESFNDMYKDNTYQITDISQAFASLCRSENFHEDTEVYKKLIGYFIAYVKKQKLDPNNIIDHTYMYYFIQNIITLDYYSRSNEDDVAFHNTLVDNIQKLIDVVKAQ